MIHDAPKQDATPSFGYWVRRRRQALDLTQADLARLVNYALVTISKIERDERRPSRQMAQLLAEKLQIPLAERADFVAMALGERTPDRMPPATVPLPPAADFPTPAPQPPDAGKMAATSGTDLAPELGHPPAPPPAMPPAPRPRLPVAPTPFIGRAAELSQLEERLREPACRLITVAGPGGIGKTRLALRLAERAASDRDEYPDGVYFVSADGLPSPDLLVASLCNALDVHPDAGAELLPQFLVFLADKQLLIVLDGFEQILAGAPVLVELLAAAPGIKLLVTSWEALNLLEEWFYPLSGMLVYESDVFDHSHPVLADSVKLFVQCARRVDPSFDIAREYDRAVAICRLVDGIPLAIELAAGWLKSLSCREVQEELQCSIEFLTTSVRNVPLRHRSMRAVLERTWEYLTSAEQAALGKLAIFEGGFRPAAAAVVASVPAAVLANLVAKSTLQRTAPDRYRMHELLRQFALKRLTSSPARPGTPRRLDALATAHSRFYLELLAARLPQIEGPDPAGALDEIRSELDNVRAAWRCAVARQAERGERDPALGAALDTALASAVDALYAFLELEARFDEGYETFGTAARLLRTRAESDLAQRMEELSRHFAALRGRPSAGGHETQATDLSAVYRPQSTHRQW